MNPPQNRLRGLLDSGAAAWAAVGGAALGFAQPGWNIAGLGLVALLPLLYALRARKAGSRAVLGWIAGSIAAPTAAGDTAAIALETFFGLSTLPLGFAWMAADQLLGALPVALFALLAGDPQLGRPMAGALTVAAAWVVSEVFRELLFPGAWLSLASTLSSTPVLLQSAAWVGRFGVSFWIAGFSFLVFRMLFGPNRSRARPVAAALVALLFAQTWWSGIRSPGSGGIAIATESAPAAGQIRIALVQSGVDSRASTPPPSDGPSLEVLTDLTSEGGPADLVVWPESALHGIWPLNAAVLESPALGGVVLEHLLLGVPWMEGTLRSTNLTVAAALVDSKGRIQGRYRKTKLLPFAEDRRTRRLMNLKNTPRGYSPAAAPELLAIGTTELGVSICYEILFSSLAREQVQLGAGLLVNLSNESWLGPRSRGPDHMLAAAVLRAVEVRRPVVRSTTTGLTAAIDAYGRVIATLPREAPGTLRVDATPSPAHSVYTRIGDLPARLCAFGWIALAMLRRYRTR